MKKIFKNFFVKNSKEVNPGDTFFSILGLNTNGNLYIIEAIERGAIKIFVQRDNPVKSDIISIIEKQNISLIYVEDIYYEFGKHVSCYFKDIVSRFVFIGVTGTKGKTTTVNAIFNLLQNLNFSSAMMSSAVHKINNIEYKASLTTEMINDIYFFLEEALQYNVTHVVLEVSAQAFTQYRVLGILFDAFIFTNFSQEHGESYSTQEDYFLAKCQLYKYIKHNGIVLLNKDDKKVISTMYDYSDTQCIFKTYSQFFDHSADMIYNIEKNDINFSQGILYYRHNTYIFSSPWIGAYNIGNISAAILILSQLLFLSEEKIIFLLKQVKFFSNISGRNEKYFLNNNKIVCIEKACTPNSVHSTLGVLRNLSSNMIVVFGCGGDKDFSKRPILAKIIEEFADIIYVTTDNPRNELIENIFLDISKGFIYNKDIFFIKDRKIAIEMAIERASCESIIVLLGKGDEEYQLIKGIKYPFIEKEIIKKYLKKDI